jgi:hypothetical protein
MTPRRSLAALALGAAMLARPAMAFEGSGVVGGGYSQTDNWAPGLSDRIPVWNWMAGGSFQASPLSPGLLQIDASAQYDALRNTAAHAPSNSNGWTFRTTTLLLGDYLPTSLYASRGVTDFSVDTGTPQSGSTLSQIYGGSVQYQLTAGPLLNVSASRTDQTTRPLAGDEYRLASNRASAQASQNLSTFDYRLNYETTWSDGSFTDTNYRQHALAFAAGADLTSEDRIQLNAQYGLRDPAVRATTNPRFDTEFLQGSAMLGTQSRWTGFASYSYSHSLIDAVEAAQLEQTNHGVSYTTTYRYTDALLFNASAGANYATARNDAQTLKTTGEQAGVGASWTHGDPEALQLQLSGNGNVGALQPESGPGLPGYGIGVTGSLRQASRSWTGTANYQLTFARNLGGVEGTSFSQRVAASGDTRTWSGLTLGARVTFSSSRRDAALLGTSIDRSAAVGLTAGWQRLRAEATAGTGDGLSETLRSPGFSDGLFLSPSFNTHTRYASLLVRQAGRRLSLSLLGRFLESEAPARPRQYEVSGSALLDYDVGQFTFRLEDRITHGGDSGSWTRTNVVFVRMERRFDVRF